MNQISYMKKKKKKKEWNMSFHSDRVPRVPGTLKDKRPHTRMKYTLHCGRSRKKDNQGRIKRLISFCIIPFHFAHAN